MVKRVSWGGMGREVCQWRGEWDGSLGLCEERRLVRVMEYSGLGWFLQWARGGMGGVLAREMS